MPSLKTELIMPSIEKDFSFFGWTDHPMWSDHMDFFCMCLVVVQTYHQRKDILYLNGQFMVLTLLEWNLILFESRASTKPFLVYLKHTELPFKLTV